MAIGDTKVTTSKVFVNPGVGRLVMTNATDGTTFIPLECAVNETIKWMATGWTCTSSVPGGIAQGGNSFASPVIVGTNDNFPLQLKSNGVVNLTLDAGGFVGVGVTNPVIASV